MPTLKANYAYWRAKGKPALAAIVSARADLLANVTRYPSSAVKCGYSSGAAFAAFGERHMRWIESPSAAGLRFVGYCDKIADRAIRHTGWFLGDDMQDETARGVVFRMAGRNGRARYIAGYQDPCNGSADRDGPVCLSFDVHIGDADITSSWDEDSAARDAAYAADGIAERMAESERDYRRAQHAGMKHAELGEDVARMRRSALALIREIKSHKSVVCDAPAIVAALRDRLESIVDAIREAREERRDLLADFGREPAFHDH